MRELEKYQKTEAYKHFTRKVQEKQKGKRHRGGESSSLPGSSLDSLPEGWERVCGAVRLTSMKTLGRKVTFVKKKKKMFSSCKNMDLVSDITLHSSEIMLCWNQT